MAKLHTQVSDDVPLALGHIEHLNDPEIDLQSFRMLILVEIR